MLLQKNSIMKSLGPALALAIDAVRFYPDETHA
jgi:hypothetical protein